MRSAVSIRVASEHAIKLAFASLLALVVLACRAPSVREYDQMPTRSITDVLKEHSPRLMAIPGVVGTYEGAMDDGTPCIAVMVVRRTAQIEREIPARLEGHPVRIEETGEIQAMPDSG